MVGEGDNEADPVCAKGSTARRSGLIWRTVAMRGCLFENARSAAWTAHCVAPCAVLESWQRRSGELHSQLEAAKTEQQAAFADHTSDSEKRVLRIAQSRIREDVLSADLRVPLRRRRHRRLRRLKHKRREPLEERELQSDAASAAPSPESGPSPAAGG